MQGERRFVLTEISMGYTFLWTACLQPDPKLQNNALAEAKKALILAKQQVTALADPGLEHEVMQLELAVAGWLPEDCGNASRAKRYSELARQASARSRDCL